MVRNLLVLALITSALIGFASNAAASANQDYMVLEQQGIYVARFAMPNPKAEEKLTPESRELMRFFGITMSQERLMEARDGRSLYQIFQKNALGEKSEFYEMRWRLGEYLVVAAVLNNSSESVNNLKKLPLDPWAKRKTANSEAEAGICPTCESSKLFRPLDDLIKSGREWVAVDCRADKVDGKVTAGKIISSIGSCLRGIALSVVDILKLLYDLLSTQIKASVDYRYGLSLSRVMWEAASHPQAFMQNLFSMLLQAAKDQYRKLKTCSVDYQVGFTCQLLTDLLIPGGAIIKGAKLASAGGKGAAGAIRTAVSAEARVMAAAVKPAAGAVDEVTLAARAGNEIEYVVTAGGKEAAKVTGEQVQRHMDAVDTPAPVVLAEEVAQIDKIKTEVAPGLGQLAITGSRRSEIERLYKKILDEKPDEFNTAAKMQNARTLDELARLIVDELKAKGIKAKAIPEQAFKAEGNMADLQRNIQRSEAAIANATEQMNKAAPGSIVHRNFHKQRLLEQSKLKDYKERLQNTELSKLADLVEIDLKSTAELRAVAKKLKIERILVPLREFQNGNQFSGMFSPGTGEIRMGVNSVLNPEGFLDAVAKHEFHHAASHAKKLRGVNIPYYAQVFASGQNTINTLMPYSKYFDFDEMPAYARSVAYAERGLENSSQIRVVPGIPKASTQRSIPVDIVMNRAEQLKHMSHSSLDAITMARETLKTRGFAGLTLQVTDGVRGVWIPLNRGLGQVGRMLVEPPKMAKVGDQTIVQIVSDYLDEMEAAARVHLASADRTLSLPKEQLAERIRTLTERSKNARSRRTSAVEAEGSKKNQEF